MSRFTGLWDYGSDAVESLYTRLMRERDPRFDPRVKEAERLSNLRVESEYTLPDVPAVKLSQFEGYPFVTSMSDRTAAGELIRRINDVELKDPVRLYGGQDYMFDPTLQGSVWASAKGPSNQIIGLAGEMKRMTGQDPLFMPWRMAPSGGDFASMTGETMLSYAASNMNKTRKRKLDRLIKREIPDWPGLDAGTEALAAYRAAPDAVRKSLKNQMDVNFRNEGGLSLGEARLAVTDPQQLGAPDAGTMNVGFVDTSRGLLEDTGHPSYPYGVPGGGLGRLDPEGAPLVTDLLDEGVTRYVGDEGGFVTSNWGQQRGIAPGAPSQTDIRALQMKPYGGILTEDKLRRLSDRGYDVGALAGAGVLGAGLLAPEEAEAGVVTPFRQAADIIADKIRRLDQLRSRDFNDKSYEQWLDWMDEEEIADYDPDYVMKWLDRETSGTKLQRALEMLAVREQGGNVPDKALERVYSELAKDPEWRRWMESPLSVEDLRRVDSQRNVDAMEAGFRSSLMDSNPQDNFMNRRFGQLDDEEYRARLDRVNNWTDEDYLRALNEREGGYATPEMLAGLAGGTAAGVGILGAGMLAPNEAEAGVPDAMRRAAEQGFDTATRYYKGSRKPGLSEFRINPNTGLVHASTERNVAEDFGGNVYEVYARPGRSWSKDNPADVEWLKGAVDPDQILKEMDEVAGLGQYISLQGKDEALDSFMAGLEEGAYQSLELPHVLDLLKAEGYDSIQVLEDLQSRGHNLAVFDPSRFRSVDAAFDPANIGNSNLMGYASPEMLAPLAGGTAAGVGAYSAMEDPEVDEILYRLGDYTDMADRADGFDFRRDMPLTAGAIDTVQENIELTDMPLQGLLGLATLISGQGLDAAVRNTQRPPDETMFDFGAWVQDIAQQNPVTKPYSAAIGTAAYTLPQILSPW